MENERHLKRIRKIKDEGKHIFVNLLLIFTADHVTALVCKYAEIEDPNELRSKLESLEIPFEDILVVNVPIRRPITKKQYETWNAIWPLVFHESMDEKYRNNCNLYTNPVRRLKLKQLTEHSVLFSAFQPHFLNDTLSLLIIEAAEAIPDTLDELIIYESTENKIICNEPGHSYPFDHFVLGSLNGPQKNKRRIRNGKIPYLLSGCIAILSHEPCVMCAMTLLHSRIDAVVYLERNSVSGALGSNCYLHSIDSLNHHFPVYTIEHLN